jgi:RNA polymerase sigma-70 factor (ECF subfamily)
MKPAGEGATSDDELARRARLGDEAAFDTLVDRYQERVYRLSRRLTGNRADAEDALQETFLRVFRRLSTFRGESRFSTWLYRIATNTSLMLCRSRGRRRSEPLEAYLPRFDAEGRHARNVDHARAARADVILERSRVARDVASALARLPSAYRTAFVLRDLEEMSTTEVADVLRLTPAAVRQRVHRARLMMRGYLSHLVGIEP